MSEFMQLAKQAKEKFPFKVEKIVCHFSQWDTDNKITFWVCFYCESNISISADEPTPELAIEKAVLEANTKKKEIEGSATINQ